MLRLGYIWCTLWLLVNWDLQVGQTAEINCKNGGNGHLGLGSCCNEIPFYLGHNNPQNVKDCTVEPQDPTLSFAESYWVHYACIVNKSLGNNSFTASSFAKMMAKNLPAENRQEILSYYQKLVKDPNNGNITQRLKSYWKAYFDADFQVCGRSARQSGTMKNSDRQYWDPSYTCNGEIIPIVSMLSAVEFDKYFRDVHSCEDKLKNLINNSKEAEYWEAPISDVCEYIVDGEVTYTDLINKTLDYESLYWKHDTTVVWSKNVKEAVLNGYKIKLLEKGFTDDNGFPFKNFETRLLKIHPLSEFQINHKTMKQFFINSNALSFMLDALLVVRKEKICREG